MSKNTRDPKRVTDMIFVKRLERRLGRSLTEFELEDNDEAIAFYFPDGHIEQISIPRLCFPHDVTTTISTAPVVVTDFNSMKVLEGFYEETARALQSTNEDSGNAA